MINRFRYFAPKVSVKPVWLDLQFLQYFWKICPIFQFHDQRWLWTRLSWLFAFFTETRPCSPPFSARLFCKSSKLLPVSRWCYGAYIVALFPILKNCPQRPGFGGLFIFGRFSRLFLLFFFHRRLPYWCSFSFSLINWFF